MATNNTLSFYEKFKDDILSKKKTITIRDKKESEFTIGQIVAAITNEKGEWFCDLKILNVNPIEKSELNDSHAQSENMSLQELIETITAIYPWDDSLFVITFSVVRTQRLL